MAPKDKSDLRGRPKSAEKMREESLRAGHFKGSVFIEEVQKVPNSKLRLALLRKARRSGWVKSADLARVFDMISALQSGEPLPEVQEPSSHRGVDVVPQNPGIQVAYREFLRSGGQGTIEQWLASRKRALEERQAEIYSRPKPASVVPASPPEPPPHEIATARQVTLEADARASAALNAEELIRYRASMAANEEERIYILPDGTKRYRHTGIFFDGFWNKGKTIIKVKNAPERGMALREDRNLTWAWQSRIDAEARGEQPQGMQLLANSPQPVHECDGHCRCPMIPGRFVDGVFQLPRKKNS